MCSGPSCWPRRSISSRVWSADRCRARRRASKTALPVDAQFSDYPSTCLLSVLSIKTRLVSLLRNVPAAGFSRTACRLKYIWPPHPFGWARRPQSLLSPNFLTSSNTRIGTTSAPFRCAVLPAHESAPAGNCHCWAAIGMELRKERKNESSSLQRTARRQRRGRTGCQNRASRRRAGADHYTNICGSDLHMYEGRTDFETGTHLRAREPRARWSRSARRSSKVKVGDRVVPAVQHRLRLLRELRTGPDQLLPDRAARAEARRRRLRVRRHGPVPGRPGRVPARAVRRTSTACACREDAEEKQNRLRDGRRHLPHRLARHRDGRRAARATPSSSTVPARSG